MLLAYRAMVVVSAQNTVATSSRLRLGDPFADLVFGVVVGFKSMRGSWYVRQG